MTTVYVSNVCAFRKWLLTPVALAACAFFAATVLLATSAEAAPEPKVQICHISPGNPGTWHTIEVGENAVAKHIEKHGDLLGPCNALCAVLCDDGNACTIDDAGDCEENGCPATPEPVDCNDSNACTADSCEPSTGCEYTAMNGTACTVDRPGACEEGTGVCDSSGACDPDRTFGCCLSTAECEAWDTNLCTGEECIETACVTTSTVTCETDACHMSVCIESTGECTTPEEIVCPDPECHDNGCNPATGCFSNVIDGCCISHVECDDQNNCTVDTCLGVQGCVNVECAAGDSCNILVDCEPLTCAPQTVPEVCEDDGDPCTAESCVEGLGCVSDPVICADDGDPCTVEGCSEGTCIAEPIVCEDDGDLCTAEACVEGVCIATGVQCPQGDACDPTTGQCVSLCYPAPEGLAAWWTFDTDGTDIQSSRNGVLLNGATAGATGIVGGALSLDGVNDYVQVPDSAALSTPSGITIDAWVYRAIDGVHGVIASKYNTSPGFYQASWFLGTTSGGGAISFSVYDDDVDWNGVQTTSTVLSLGVWHHVAATFDLATQDGKLYVDGVQVAAVPTSGSQSIDTVADTSVPLQIGTFTPSSGTPSNFWPGLIDELEIFDRALSPVDVAGIYNAGAEGKCRDNLPDPPCFSVIPAFGTGGGTAAVDMCIYECDARAQCSTSCALKDDPGFVEVVDACLSGANFNACVQVDTYGRENGCDNICPLPQGEADFVVCGDGGCFRHNSETGALAEVFMERPDLGICRDTERHVFFHPNGDFWMYNVRNSLSQPRSEICIYDGPESLEQTFDLPEPCDASGCTVDEFNQRPSFAITDWVATAQGNVYAVANGTCRSLGSTVCQGWGTYMWGIEPQSAYETLVVNTDPSCGDRPSVFVADPHVATEHAYAVTWVDQDQEIQLVRMELGTTTPGCTNVSTLVDRNNPNPVLRESVARGTFRLRVAADGSIYFLSRLDNTSSGWRDEGIWRVPPGGGPPEQVLAMCDLVNPGGTCTTDWNWRKKPILDFALHPVNGNLYVLESAASPNQGRIQVYDVTGPTAVSLGILREFAQNRKVIEFLPN